MTGSVEIHPSAVVHPRAELGTGVYVGPFSVVGASVALGDGVRLDSHAVVEGPTRVGSRCRFHPFSAVGGEPQDRKYGGEDTHLEIGCDNVFREGSTAHRGTERGGGVTRIGDHNLFMAHSHVAHDCTIGNHCVFANSAAIAGHVEIHDHAVLGGMAGIHQHARVGRLAMVGAGAMVAQDVPPFCIAQGDRARLFGLNIIGLRRYGISRHVVLCLRRAFRGLFQQGAPPDRVREELTTGPFLPPDPGPDPEPGPEPGLPSEVEELFAFVLGSRRGTCRAGGADPGPTDGGEER